MIGHTLEWLIAGALARLFPGRWRVIPRMPDGLPLLRQFRVCSFGAEKPRGTPPWWHVSVYLQSFVRPETFADFHIHRWRRMISFVLSGRFEEERWPTWWHGMGLERLLRPHAAPSCYTMNSDVIHRVGYVAPRTWTLFIMLGRNLHEPRGGWGYFERRTGRYRAWDEAIPENRRVDAL